MKSTYAFVTLISLLLLAGCGAAPMLGNVGIPGDAQSISTSAIGKNEQLAYLSSARREAACDVQAKIISAAKWTPTEEPSVKDTYTRQTWSDGGAELTLMCSEEKEGDNYIGTKITLTMVKKSN